MSNLATITNNILADSGIDDLNVIVSTGSYSNPAWITALSWSKITGSPAFLTSVTASSPLASSGGTTPNITIQQATATQNGFLSSTDWSTFNSKQNAITLTTTGTSGAATLVGSTLNIPQYQAVLTNPITGTGTTNYLPKFTGSTTVGNSQVFDNGTNVGIGTTSPATRLMVQDSGNTFVGHFSGLNQTNGVAIGTNSLNVAVIQGYTRTFSATNNIALQADGGNLLVGTTSDNGARLQVSGAATFSSSVTAGGDGIFGDNRQGNNAGTTVVNILGSSSSTTSAQLNLTQVWNGLQYPIVLKNIYNPVAGAASSVFTLSTTQWNGSIPLTTERFRIDGNSGNVGIGTSSPSARLTIDANSSSSSDATYLALINQSGENVGSIDFNNIFGNLARITGTKEGGGGLANEGIIAFSTAVNSSLSEKMRITSSGTLLVGGTSDAAGGIIQALGSSGTAVSIRSTSAGGNQPLLRFYHDGNDEFSISGGSSLRFLSSGVTERMRITSGGALVVGNGGSIDSGGAAAGDIAVSANATKIGYIPSSTSNRGYFEAYDGSGFVNIVSTFATAGITFKTGNSATERMRVTAGGNILMGTTTDAGYTLNVAGNAQIVRSGTSTALVAGLSGVTGSIIRFSYNGGFVGSISTDGSNTAYNTSSDYRLKQDIKDFNGLDLLSRIKPYDFEWKSDKTRSYGVLAHELQEVINYAVTGSKDAEEMQGVDYSKLVPILIKAIQEQQQQIQELKNA